MCMFLILNLMHGDFVLITGATVSNMSLTQPLQENKDNNAVMTMVIKRSKPSPITHQSHNNLPNSILFKVPFV